MTTALAVWAIMHVVQSYKAYLIGAVVEFKLIPKQLHRGMLISSEVREHSKTPLDISKRAHLWLLELRR